MLDAVEITSADVLTADDAALHELLISAAYEADKGMGTEFTSLPVSTALKFLGQHARRDALKVSMRRLMSTTVSYGNSKSRRFEDVPLVFSYLETTEDTDVIRYSLPEPIRILMREMPAYAYLELAPISQMKSKYSVRLYRVFAAAAAREKWVPGGQNKVVVSASLEDLYQWTGFALDKGTMNFGKFRQRVLKDLPSELSTVRRFGLRIEEIRKEARGRSLERVDFHLNLRAPSHHMTRMGYEPGDHKQRKIGGVDDPKFRVNSNIWLKAEKNFWNERKFQHRVYYHAWLIALQEALDKDPVSPGYTRREYRGHRLLNAISTLGADEAAFKFCAEEVADPDIAEDNWAIALEMPQDAREARKLRIEASEYVQTKKLAPKAPPQVENTQNVEKEPGLQKTGVPILSDSECNPPLKALSFTKPSRPNTPLRRPEPTVAISAIEEEGAIEITDLDAQMLADLISDEADEITTQPSLEGVKEIIWTADRGMPMDEIEKEIWPAFQFEPDGPYEIELTVRAWVDGLTREYSFGTYKVSMDDIENITKSIGRVNLDDELSDLEYIR
ncbi:hypothetical protein O206_00035 [Ochrobactrum sp. EGD-AQ16]|nr:hypothetical protein O206_00035 [Ochrobactrum sp. EGD-AQ16]